MTGLIDQTSPFIVVVHSGIVSEDLNDYCLKLGDGIVIKKIIKLDETWANSTDYIEIKSDT